MSQFLRDLRFMIRDAWASRGSGKADYVDPKAKTMREASHVNRGATGVGGLYGEQVADQIQK